MDNRDWLILKLLYEKKNISKTALSLYISQPALTNRLQQLEKEFGVQIVLRERRGVSFTPEGEYLVKYAEEMLLRLDRVKENISNMKDGVSGTLRLGASKFMMKHKLPRILKLFKENYPNVEFKIVTGWSRDVFNLIYNQDVHIGFVRGDYNWPDSRHLLFEENICVVSKSMIDMKALPKLPRIEYKTDYLFKSILDNWWSENYSAPPLVSIEVDQVDTCREMVINDLGYAIMHDIVVKETDDLHRINITDKDGEPILRRTWMFYHEDLLKLNLVKAFVDFIKSCDLTSL
ncbi:LysR family transcriptional regulator [Clostridium sp. YIM B02515]|uniref:LysR family transcriptional regulator n=1 Tax=Clostridium rhizosphaerae TaxID=2803861 RepID=A0ABS1TFQ3_9CLOT|nr:LysR family transcriptional regulator [Clostridium rhizosphaerae]MBL4938218.1 LysR family transcriptional regulator [Clostridium rhizosphaerae]